MTQFTNTNSAAINHRFTDVAFCTLRSDGTLYNWALDVSTGDTTLFPGDTIYMFSTSAEMLAWLDDHGLVMESKTPPPPETI